MSEYYKPRRVKNLYNPNSKEPFRLSRSKIDLFIECQRCFYLDRRLGVSRPPGFPFALNSAVDTLLKKEFDIHRAKKTAHPLMETYDVKALPFAHEKMDLWRDALRGGIQYCHPPTNFLVTGGIDDIWINKQEELIIVDYKATAKNTEINLDAEWQESYKRQVEVYQWLFRKNGFKVSKTTYFVYCNGRTDRKAFDGKLEFEIKLIPYVGDDSWIEETLFKARECLIKNEPPISAPGCDYCNYLRAIGEVEHPGKLF
ncbi:MAG: PD-(D/E)XK nuclease family protein [Patescibacteria group bacterium]